MKNLSHAFSIIKKFNKTYCLPHVFIIYFLSFFTYTSIYSFDNFSSKTFKNGFQVLFKKTTIPQDISLQLWINVGSKHENDTNRGIAHIVEHMLFKGTKKLSEQDLFQTIEKLSGEINAATGKDSIYIPVSIPKEYWHEALALLSDVFTECTFKNDLLQSELKAIIQELRRGNDNEWRVAHEQLFKNIFTNHTYKHPVIGYKESIWATTSEKILEFYKTYFRPDNALLIVVGDLDESSVYNQAENYFGSLHNPQDKILIPESTASTEQENQIEQNIHDTTIKHDVTQQKLLFSFPIMGLKNRTPIEHFALELLGDAMCNSKSARLEADLVQNRELLEAIQQDTDDLFDYDITNIYCIPTEEKSTVEEIRDSIIKEFSDIAINGLKDDELERLYNSHITSYYESLQSNVVIASFMGEYFSATKNINFLSEIKNISLKDLNNVIKKLTQTYFTQANLYLVRIEPFATEEEKTKWLEKQAQEDAQDKIEAEKHIRESTLEEVYYTNLIRTKRPEQQNYVKPNMYRLNNGVRIIYHKTDHIPTSTILINLESPQATASTPAEQYATLLFNVFYQMLDKSGTPHKTAAEVAASFEQLGANLNISNGLIKVSVLSKNTDKTLALIYELLSGAIFEEKMLEQVKRNIRFSQAESWSEASFLADIMVERGYQKKLVNYEFSEKILDLITLEALDALRTSFITPNKLTISIVGSSDFNGQIKQILEKTFGSWHMPLHPKTHFSKISTHYLDRDQVLIRFGGISVNKFSSHADSLFLYDQQFNHGLFNIREATGLFYSISGSLLASSSDYLPGEWYVEALVSPEHVHQACSLILDYLNSLKHAINFNESDLENSRDTQIRSYRDLYSSNSQTALTFLYLDAYKRSFNIFEERAELLKKITLEQIQQAVNFVLHPDNISVAIVGRIGERDVCTELMLKPWEHSWASLEENLVFDPQTALC